MRGLEKRKKGFTLIELLVVISITVITTSMVFANMQVGRRLNDVNSSAEKLTGVFKQAQMMALSGKTFSGNRPDGGCGVYLDNSTDPHTYILFVNDSEPANYQYNDGGDTVIQSFSLAENVVLESFDYNTLIFTPPYGKIFASNGVLAGEELADKDPNSSLITIKHTDARFISYVRINEQGEIGLWYEE